MCKIPLAHFYVNGKCAFFILKKDDKGKAILKGPKRAMKLNREENE